MTKIVQYPQERGPNGGEENPFFEETIPAYSVVSRVVPDEVDAGSTRRPETVPKRPMRPRLPPVDAFDFEEACAAKSFAHKFAPRTKQRNAEPRRHNEQDGETEPQWWDRPRRAQPPRGRGGSRFMGFCTTMLIAVGTPAAFGLIQPLNDMLPAPMGDFLSDFSHELSASLLDHADPAVLLGLAGGGSRTDGRALIPTRPVTASVVKSMSRAPSPAEPEAEPAPVEGGKAAPDLMPAEEAAPDAAPEPPKEKPLLVASLQPADGPEPLRQTDAKQAAAYAPASSTPQAPAVSPLSRNQIERLLKRGKALMESGDIASARLLFERVAAAGDPRGALGVGMTYDPNVYARLSVTGLSPDRERSQYWYEKAGNDVTLAIGGVTAGETAAAKTQGAQLPGSPEWNAACAEKYNSFDPSTGLYTSYSGPQRPCRLP